MIRNFGLLATALAMAIAPAASTAHAQSFTAGDARNAVEAGDIIPLKDIFARLRSRYGGYQLSAELFSTSRGAEYRIAWMTEDGRRLQLTVDAQSGRILQTRGG